jgi:hypothetical protein
MPPAAFQQEIERPGRAVMTPRPFLMYAGGVHQLPSRLAGGRLLAKVNDDPPAPDRDSVRRTPCAGQPQ